MFAALAPAVLFGADMFTSLFRAPGHPQTALLGRIGDVENSQISVCGKVEKAR